MIHKVHEVWSGRANDFLPPVKQQEEKDSSPSYEDFSAFSRSILPESQFAIIAEKNLFLPERKSPTAQPDMISLAPSSSNEPKGLILSGVLIAEDYRAALIGFFPGTTEGRHQWIREGERINGLEVSIIKKDRIILSENEKEEYEILLYDSGKIKNRSGQKDVRGPTVIISDAAEQLINAVESEQKKEAGQEQRTSATDKQQPNERERLKDKNFKKTERALEIHDGKKKTGSGNVQENSIETPFGTVSIEENPSQ